GKILIKFISIHQKKLNMETYATTRHRVQLINHEGKEVLIADFSNAVTQEEMLEVLDEVGKRFEELDDKVYYIADITNTFNGPKVMKRVKEIGKKYLKHKCIINAVVGVSKIQTVLLEGLNSASLINMKPFRTKQDALNFFSKHRLS
ncbi:MAG: hypothetical protein AAF551_08935, partial [Bacteroidota bacterium]